jgi:adenylate cyclase class 2
LEYVEIEIKIKIDQVEAIRKQLLLLKFYLSEKEYFESNMVFDSPPQKLYKSDSLLRLRKKNNSAILTLKNKVQSGKPDSGYKIRNEIESVVSNAENIQKILFALGYEIFFIYEKYREVYRQKDVIVTLDRTPIGDFIEIESDRDRIDETAHLLGFEKKDYIIDSYYTLFREHNPTGHMVFK